MNTTYFWEGKIGMFAMLTFLLLILYFLVLTGFLIRQIFLARNEGYKNRKRLFLIGFMTIVLSAFFFYPGGLINFENFESNSILIAQDKGAANCMTTLKLREDMTFIQRNVCFGVTEITGTYNIKGDTIFFDKISLGRHESEFYKFAVIKNRETKSENYFGALVRFKDYVDTIGSALYITKNELSNDD